MKFKDQQIAEKANLALSEHFVLINLIDKLPIYVFMWVICLLLSILLSSLPFSQPIVDYESLKAFSRSFIMISTITITFAIPTCMRSIFSAYDQYYSTKISEILLDRFPVTLLSLSAFTSLSVSIMVVSGIIGEMIVVPPILAFYVVLFWLFVCIFYLFVAIEKLVYFIANAPGAVVKKLEYGVTSNPEISTKEEYKLFRKELASMNDIASTIISKSTGTDDSVIEILNSFKEIHKHYLSTADNSNHKQYRYHANACRAVDHEMTRMFRIASSTKNENACRDILKTYCAMIVNTMQQTDSLSYFSDMMSQISKFQSYAEASNIEEIKTLASVTWFFMLGDIFVDIEEQKDEKYSIIVRMLSTSLRQATEHNQDGIIVKFLRIASNSEIDPDITLLPETWKNLLDRAIFIYTVWLVDMMPTNADKFIDYLWRYSNFNSDVFRSVLPDNSDRINTLIKYENLLYLSDNVDSQNEGEFITDKTAVVMSLSLKDTAAHTIVLLSLLDHANIEWDYLGECGDVGCKIYNEILESPEIFNDDIGDRIKLITTIAPSFEKHIEDYKEQIK